MDAMILSAGRGERLRPLTDRTPKPLIRIGQRRLIEIHLQRLRDAGFMRVIINLAHLGNRIREALGDGSRYGLRILYSQEPPGALETGGGIRNALPLIADDAFLVINGDVLTDFPFAERRQRPLDDAHLVLVDNPAHHPGGDFTLNAGQVGEKPANAPGLTYSGIGVYHRQLFEPLPPGRFPLAPLLHGAIRRRRVSGQHYRGSWLDVGTPERLAEARARVAAGVAI